MSAWDRVADQCRAEHARFRGALSRPTAAQRACLATILADNAGAAFGVSHDFAKLKGPDDYRAAVPPQDYRSLAPEIERMARGEPRRLVGEPPVAFEQTSGSGAAVKLLPLTAAGLAGFRRAVAPWLADLIESRPRIRRGRAYWAISPVCRSRGTTAAGTPLGLDDDTDYLGPDLGADLGALLAVPAALRRVADPDAWRYGLLRCLIDAGDLSLVSVWSPTFLLPLFETLQREADRLATDVARGTVSWPDGRAWMPDLDFGPRPERAAALRRATSSRPLDVTVLWPGLDTLSCWTHGNAARFVGDLVGSLPGVRIQGKGLLATEAAVSVPQEEFAYPVLAVHSAFFEFLEDNGVSRLAGEVETDRAYRLLVTTASGLYRYDLGDRVRVRGFAERTPMLEFTGRAGLVSDLCGEKLAEDFVARALADVDGFAVLAPKPPPARGYSLLLDAARVDAPSAAAAAARVEGRLWANPQYAYARRVGQLAAVQALRMHEPLDAWRRRGLERGTRFGDIKPLALDPYWDWAEPVAPADAAPRRLACP